MGAAPLPPNEVDRLASLRARAILDTEPEAEFDALVHMAAEICNVPIALVSLIDENRQWFKAKVGIDATETPREVAYCAHAILQDSIMEVPDAELDPRFADNPLRAELPATFYAGVPLETSDGHRLGTLCIVDRVPRKLTEAQRTGLEALAAQVVRLLEDRKRVDHTETISVPPRDEEFDVDPAAGVRTFSGVAFFVALALGIATIGASMLVRTSVERAERLRLAQAMLRAERFLDARTAEYDELLRGAAALFAASEDVTELEFRAYVRALRLEQDHRGVLGVGFTERVPREAVPTFLADVRASRPSFEVASTNSGPELAVIRFVEPLADNLRALGFDMRSSPERAIALDASLRDNAVTMTERVLLRQDPSGGPGFLFFLPAQSANGARRGWVFVVVRGHALVGGVERAAGENVSLVVRDAEDREPLLGVRTPRRKESLESKMTLYNRTLSVRVDATDGFSSPLERMAPYVVLFLGLGAAALSFGLVAALRRVDARSRLLAAQMTESLRTRTRELREVFDGTADLILTFDDEGHIKLANRAFRHVLGYADDATRKMSVLDVVHDTVRPEFERALKELGQGARRRKLETIFVSKEGAPIDVEGALTHDALGGTPMTRAIFRDVSGRNHAERALRAANTALERLAAFDSLTGVANRRTFDERLAEETARAKRHASPLSLVMLDVDHFKLYNDRYGHPAGDECLRRVGACLRTVTRRAGELAARYGGEEFALLLPGADRTAAVEIAERLRLVVESMKLPHERHPLGIVTVSLGVATFDATVKLDPGALVREADRALYAAKAGGRNRVVASDDLPA